jgi:hypothetical protein
VHSLRDEVTKAGRATSAIISVPALKPSFPPSLEFRRNHLPFHNGKSLRHHVFRATSRHSQNRHHDDPANAPFRALEFPPKDSGTWGCPIPRTSRPDAPYSKFEGWLFRPFKTVSSRTYFPCLQGQLSSSLDVPHSGRSGDPFSPRLAARDQIALRNPLLHVRRGGPSQPICKVCD